MPSQEAPQFAHEPVAVSAPLFPIPEYRQRQFAKGVGERLRQGAMQGWNEAQVLASIKAEREALAQVLAEPALHGLLAQSYRAAHDRLVPAAPVSAAASEVVTTDILTNRMNDARQLARLVEQPDFVNAARTQAALPAEPAQPYRLSPEKITEMVDRFASDGAGYGPDATIHVQQEMEGQRIGHLALAEAFADNGPLMPTLTRALAARLGDEATAQRLAADWLEARRNPAVATAETLAEGGVVYRAVMERVHNAHRTAQIERKPLADAAPPALLPATGALIATPLLARSSALTPVEREEAKTAQQKAEDVMYTLNHAITCLSVTDTVIAPTVATMSEKWFGKRVNLCGHDHDHHDHHDHHKHDHAEKKPFFKRLGNWMIGEVAGDVGAVLPTVLMQRFTPGVMNGIRSALEPMVGGFFRRGTQRAAENWGIKNNLAADDQAVVDRAQELYEYEVSHLPQMAVWTLSSVLINFGVMKFRDRNLAFKEFIGPKAAGAAVTAGLVVSARALSPNGAHSWDQTMGHHVVAPLTKLIGKPFGVKEEDVERFAKKRAGDDRPQWQGRLQEKAPELAPSA